jgi:hypothetical protein
MDLGTIREKVKRKKFSEAHLLLEAHLSELGLRFEREFPFCDGRNWRADYKLWNLGDGYDGNILVEIEGAVWQQGRHTRGSGYVRDLEKYRMASALGFKLFRFTTEEVLNGTAKDFLEKWT